MSRYRSRVLVAVGVLAVTFGIGLQHRWDAQCAAAEPGTRWDANRWECRQ